VGDDGQRTLRSAAACTSPDFPLCMQRARNNPVPPQPVRDPYGRRRCACGLRRRIGGIDEACRSTCSASWPHAKGKITEEMGIDEATEQKNQSN
jgi:hypothetical protein